MRSVGWILTLTGCQVGKVGLMSDRLVITIEHRGRRYSGAYYLSGDQLVVEAAGLGQETADARILGRKLGRPAEKLAKLLLTELVKENTGEMRPLSELALEGSTTQLRI